MRLLVGILLGLSLAANVWLIVDRESAPVDPTDPGERPTTGETTSAPTLAGAPDADTHSLALKALQEKLAEAEKALAARADVEPIGLVLHAKKPLTWRIRKLLDFPAGKARNMAAWKLGIELGKQDDAAATLLELFETESDEEMLDAVYQLLRSGAMGKATPEVRRAFARHLADASPFKRRVAAQATFMTEAFRGGFSEEIKTLANEMNAYVVQALERETDADVVEAIASSFSNWYLPEDALAAFEDAAARLPPSKGRRRVYEALARQSYFKDRGASLFKAFDEADDPQRRNDIAAGLARAGNSGGGPIQGTSEEVDRDMAQMRTRVLHVYENTGDSAVRRSLARGALYGLNCVSMWTLDTEERKRNAIQFFRDLAARESDDEARGRLTRFVEQFTREPDKAYQHFDRIVSGRK